jgi:Single-stranded DNA-specific exonuclease
VKIEKICTSLRRLAEDGAEVISRSEDVLVVSHIDADGLTAAGVICTALSRKGIDYTPLFFKQLDSRAIERIADAGSDLVIFTDLGSGMIQEISSFGIRAVIADHHRPGSAEIYRGIVHINPHLLGGDGATHISGSGTAFILANAMGRNEDLSALAVVGAVGDLQDLSSGRLVGLNRRIIEVGSRAGVLSFGPDLKLFGKQTRPVFKMLEYSTDPYIPGLSGDEEACISFLKEIGIRLGGERWRRWIDLDQDERARIVSALIRHGLRSGIPGFRLERLVGEVYTLSREREGTELRDASEFSTLLNATARYGHSRIGLDVCLGDRDRALEEARLLLSQHRQNLLNGIKLVKERGLVQLSHIQYFDAGEEILDTIVGIVAGMVFQIADRSKPILAFAATPDGMLKVSARGTQDLVRAGLDLSRAVSASANEVGGVGGGHSIAAGATIPPQSRDEFLSIIDRVIGEQMKSRGS